MANFPVAAITAARVNILKGELTVQLRVPFNPDTEADVLKQAAGLRRMFEAEAPVMFTVRPLWEQPGLLPEDAPEAAATRRADWRALLEAAEPAPEPEPPAAPDPDRPTGQTLDDFLSGEES